MDVGWRGRTGSPDYGPAREWLQRDGQVGCSSIRYAARAPINLIGAEERFPTGDWGGNEKNACSRHRVIARR